MISAEEQLKSERLKERVIFNRVVIVSVVCLIVIETILTVFTFAFSAYYLFIPIGVVLLGFILPLCIYNTIIRKKEEDVAVKKLRRIVDGIVIKDEYDLPVMDIDFTVKVTKSGFIIDGELFGYDNFDIFLGTSNLYRQVSVAVFVVSNFSPFSDDKVYPMNFGIVLDSVALGCAKQYFFDKEYKAFNCILENPEQSAKEILKYGRLKIQIEEEKKQKALDKLAKELSQYE